MLALSLSDFLGYVSIACWLGAQFPQVLENMRRKSCEGLALPFLANWLLGDFSNLVGCILTHQLPFQTYLATYFVIVDCTLVAQYFYYAIPTGAPSTFGRPTIETTRRVSVDRGASRYRTLSAAAANVAAAAALAAHQDEYTDRRRVHSRWQTQSGDHFHGISAAGDPTIDDEVDDDALAALADSFHSEGGRRRVSWSMERSGTRGGSVGRHPVLIRTAVRPPISVTSTELTDPSNRGRPLLRDERFPPAVTELAMSTNRHSSRAGRRGATMVFLGVCALFGFGTLSQHGLPSSSTANIGEVLFAGRYHMPEIIPVALPAQDTPSIPAIDTRSMYLADLEADPPPRQGPPLAEPSAERLLGRIFAWLCTTLYLTSRLPQIWKNYTRKSVEGLSMYLFVFAFLGNTFYVSSIVSSPNMYLPPPASTAFIRESIPYLLGSAGTLMFDITIVAQSFIYRPRPRRHASHSRMIEEESGLLAGDLIQQQRSYTEASRGRASSTSTIV